MIKLKRQEPVQEVQVGREWNMSRKEFWEVIVVVTFLIFILFWVEAHAATITLKWDAQTDATGFKIDQSINSGVVWTEVKDAGNVTQTTVTVPDTGLVLFRIKAYNAQGMAIRTDAGAWFNGTWKMPASPTGAGIQ